MEKQLAPCYNKLMQAVYCGGLFPKDRRLKQVKQQQYNTALYMRLSRDDELEGESASISTQKQILRDYANEQGFLVVDEYVDDGFSGTNFERPSFKRMIEDIEDGKINCVVTKDLSRLGRNYILTGQYTELYFPSKGVRYIAIHDGVDTIREDNDIAPFKNIVNEWQAKETSRKVKNAMKAKFKNGEYIAPVTPLGYKLHPTEKNRLIIDEETKWIAERIFELAAHGYGAKKICHALAKDKVPVPTWWLYKRNGYKASMFEGKPEEVKYRWCIQTVSNILANQIYLGHTVHYKLTKMSYKSKKNIKHSEDEWFVVENTHEPIVTQDLWDLVQTHVNSRRRSRKDDEPQIFAGLIRCGECGWTLGSANTKDKGRFYRCTQYAAYGRNFCTLHYTPYKILYAFVLGRLQYWLMAVKENEDAILERLLQGSEKQRQSENARAEKELKKAQKRRQELNSLFAKMYEDRVKGLLDEENYSMLSVKYRTEQQQLDETVKTISARLEETKEETDDAKRWIDLIQKYSAIDELTAPLLNELIEKIVVHQSWKDGNGRTVRDIEIYYRFVGKID